MRLAQAAWEIRAPPLVASVRIACGFLLSPHRSGTVRGIAAPQFLERFHSDAVKAKTRRQFEQTQQAGVRGFPTLLGQDASGIILLTHGYRAFEELRPEIEAWLARPAGRKGGKGRGVPGGRGRPTAPARGH